jgi:hypothetical protein
MYYVVVFLILKHDTFYLLRNLLSSMWVILEDIVFDNFIAI